jgi:hypothetical protein
MSPHPADRYATARTLVEAIDGWFSRRKRFLHPLALAGIALVSGIAIGISAALLTRPYTRSAKGTVPGIGSHPTVIASTPLTTPDTPRIADEPRLKAAEVAPTPATLDPDQLVANVKQKTYHQSTCRYAETANRILLRNAAEAKERNYKPCKICKPREPDPEITSTNG